MSMHLVITLFVILVYQLSLLQSGRVERGEKGGTNGLNCAICKRMFNVDFDFDKLVRDKESVKMIRNEVGSVEDGKIETNAKEVSMQFFFKGGDAQFEGSGIENTQVINCKGKINENCELMRSKLCEGILSLDANSCMMKNNFRFESLPVKNNLNIPVNNNNSNNNINSPSSSFVQLTPDFINENFDSVPKSHWKPPKPVLLQNFEQSIGVQLKEISQLTSEIAKYEKKVKELKQQLANRLEVAQSSYTVIQKTLQQISQMVNKPYLPDLIKSPSQFTEDDWDESAKGRFLN